LEKYLASNNPVQDAALFPLQLRNCTTAAERRKFVSNLYYVRNYAVTAGDGVPTLMRSQFTATATSTVPVHQAPEALIEGIEGFRVEYGVDNLSDSGAAVNFGAAIAWANASNKTSPTNRGDGIPDGAYIRCTTGTPCTSDQLSNVVAVKLYVLVRAEQKTPGYQDTKTYNLGSTTLGPFNDEYKRHLFMQTIRLTNVASRRETP
jgi:type IV pilus assembly protein PilW